MIAFCRAFDSVNSTTKSKALSCASSRYRQAQANDEESVHDKGTENLLEARDNRGGKD